jgi:hypothetical protein
MKPTELLICSIRPTQINSYTITKIEVDLRHINYGLTKQRGYGKKARSNFKIEDIITFFESLNNIEVESERDDAWEYFVVDKVFFDQRKKYRIVFCINQNSPLSGGIITFFQVQRSKS